jgi:hypothetical protein
MLTTTFNVGDKKGRHPGEGQSYIRVSYTAIEKLLDLPEDVHITSVYDEFTGGFRQVAIFKLCGCKYVSPEGAELPYANVMNLDIPVDDVNQSAKHHEV